MAPAVGLEPTTKRLTAAGLDGDPSTKTDHNFDELVTQSVTVPVVRQRLTAFGRSRRVTHWRPRPVRGSGLRATSGARPALWPQAFSRVTRVTPQHPLQLVGGQLAPHAAVNNVLGHHI